MQPVQIPGTQLATPRRSESTPSIYKESWKYSKTFQLCQALEISDIASLKHYNGFQNVKLALTKRHGYWNTKEKELDRNINRLCYLYVIKALYDLGWTPEVGSVLLPTDFQIVDGLHLAFQHYMSYLEQENLLDRNTHILKSMPPTKSEVDWEIRQLIENELREYGPVEILHLFGSKLALILQDNLRGRYLLFGKEKNGSTYAELYYKQTRFHFGMFQAPADVFVQIALELWSVPKNVEKEPHLRVLEVGSGTEYFTAEVLERMTQLGIPFQYVFADFSPSVLARVQMKLGTSHPGGQLEFKVMNIENDPLEQGLPPNYFDVVVGVHVFHATTQLERTMANVKKLVKRGGMLVMGEVEKPVREFDICFGTSSAYWLFEDNPLRQTHCTVNSNVWKRILGDVGFEKNELYDMHLHQGHISVMAARHVGRYMQMSTEREWIMIQCGEEKWCFHEFRLRMQQLGRKCYHREFSEIASNAEDGRDAQTEVDKVMAPMQDKLEGVLFWYDKNQDWKISEPQSRQLLEPLLCVAKFLGRCGWKRAPKLHLISGRVPSRRRGDASRHWHVDNSLLLGFMRIFRVEMPHIHSKCIELKFNRNPCKPLIYDSVLNELWTDEDNETEITISNKSRLVWRLIRKEEEACEKILEFPSTRYTIELPESKILSDLKYVPNKALEYAELRDNQVEVLVKSASLSCKDVYTIEMLSVNSKQNQTVGQDFAGVVCGVGGKVRKWKVGDRIFGCSWKEGTVRSHLVADADMIQKIPDNMTFNEAATLPTPFQIAWHCLQTLTEMQQGQTVLIHDASGDVGLACIQLAKCLHLQIFATAKSARERNFLRSFGIPHVFDAGPFKYVEHIINRTWGQGVDAVLSCLPRSRNTDISQECLKTNGHFVCLGNLAFPTSDTEEVPLTRDDLRTHSVDTLSIQNSDTIVIMNELIKMLSDGRFKPLPFSRYPAAKIIDALNLLKETVQMGKVVVEMPEVDSKSEELKERTLFNERSSYVITGGLGAFGLAVAKWMLKNGAKFLILVSRSKLIGEAENEYAKIVDFGAERGAKVIFRQCDVLDLFKCSRLFKEFSLTDTCFPPIRGVHHCWGIHSNKLIVDENCANFETVLIPKIKGAWNLHQVTRHLPLEFFVVHSSTAGAFGNAGQSTDITANCYTTSLIKTRRAINLPGLSVNWGNWRAGLASNLYFSWLQPFSIQNGMKALEELMRETNLCSAVVANLKFPEIIDIFPKYERTLFVNLPEIMKLKMETTTDLKKGEENRCTLYELLQQRMQEDRGNLSLEVKTGLVRKCVSAVVCDLLGVKEMDPQIKFLDVGMDSQMIVKFIYQLQDEMGPLTLGFLDIDNDGTVDKMTDLMIQIFDKECGDQF